MKITDGKPHSFDDSYKQGELRCRRAHLPLQGNIIYKEQKRALEMQEVFVLLVE